MPEIMSNEPFLQLAEKVVTVINEQLKLHGVATVCVMVPTKVDEPVKEPEWREPGPWDVGNPTAQFRDVDYEMWLDDFGCWRGTFFCDDGTLIHISGDSGVTWKQARVKDHGPQIAPKSSN
jgi:hypothetical protein